MAVPCPRCGREYDVTLFQFGRTIHCTCGARVGLEKRIPLEGPAAGHPEEPVRLILDAMLGRLARWLRVLGYDAAYDPHIEDEELVRRALDEGRVLVTRDTRLPEEWRVAGVVVLGRDEPLGQLTELADRLGLRPEAGWRARPLFTRCTVCNAVLEPVPPEEVAEEVPERVLEGRDTFRRCPKCARIYWEGSHVERMRRTLWRALEPEGESGR